MTNTVRTKGFLLAIWTPLITALACGAGLHVDDDSADVVKVSVLPGRSNVLPGEVVPIAVILDHERRWHTQAGGPDSDPESIPTTVAVSSADPRMHVRSEATQWPTAEHKPLRWAGPGASVAVYSDRTIIYVPVEIHPDAGPGVLPFTVTVGYQACDDRVCLEPVRGQPFTRQLTVLPAESDASASAATLPPATFDHPEFFAAYRPVAPQLEPVTATTAGIPGWVHVAGAVLLVLAAVLAVCSGMVSPPTVLLLRAAAAGLAIIAVILWIAFVAAG